MKNKTIYYLNHRSFFRRHSFWYLSIFILSVLFSITVSQSGIIKRIEWITQDFRTQLFRTNTEADKDIAIILIDEQSLKAMNPVAGRWPWPRSVFADLIDFLNAGEPEAIMFDILFTENEISNNGNSDQRLAEASTTHPAIFHAALFSSDKEDENNNEMLNRPLPDDFIKRFGTINNQNNTSSNNNYYLPYEELRSATPGIGLVGVTPENDGVYRRVKLLQSYQHYQYPALSIAPLIQAKTITATDVQNISLALSSNAETDYLVNYYGKFSRYSISGILASYQMLLQGDVENLLVSPEEFKDKYVLIGASAIGLEDIKTTPLSSLTPGVEIHASILSNFLQDDFLTEVPATYIYLICIILSALSVYLGSRAHHISVQTAIQAGIILLFIIFNLILFNQNIIVNLTLPILTVLSSWFGSLIYFSFTEGKDKRKVRKMLSQYVSPDILSIVENNASDHLSAEIGSSENVSILFSDIRSFTTISESLPASNVVELLNIYFSTMNDIIFKYQGTLDKFIGDAIMAFWGAPVKRPDHAYNCVSAGIAMIRGLEKINQTLAEKDYPAVAIGVGINSDDVILGNIGSEKKLDYTVIGDGVNLASRLEGLTKKYHCMVIVSEFTYEMIKDRIICAKVDLVRVKGKNIPIAIYAPLALDTDGEKQRTEAFEESQKAEHAFDLYSRMQWQDAIEAYKQLSNKELASIFIQRCEAYIETPPAKEWDSAYNLDSK